MYRVKLLRTYCEIYKNKRIVMYSHLGRLNTNFHSLLNQEKH